MWPAYKKWPPSIPIFRPKLSNSIPIFRPKRFENDTHLGRTGLCSLQRGVTYLRFGLKMGMELDNLGLNGMVSMVAIFYIHLLLYKEVLLPLSSVVVHKNDIFPTEEDARSFQRYPPALCLPASGYTHVWRVGAM